MKLFLALAIVLLLRVPFLNQAIQGDDVYYLYGAEHTQIEPALIRLTRTTCFRVTWSTWRDTRILR